MVDWQITYKCNNRCISCIFPDSLFNKDVDDKLTLQVLKENKDNIINIGGGEPTLKKSLFYILEYAQENNPKSEISLLTNARLFSYKNFVRKLESLNIKNFKLCIPLYGPELIHDKITQVKGSFNQTMCALNNLRNFTIELRIIVHRANYLHLNKTASLIIKRLPFVFRVVFINAKYAGQCLKNMDRLFMEYTELKPYVQKAAQTLLDAGIETRLFHFPLCKLDPEFREIAKGITKEEDIGFKPSCAECKLRVECPGIWLSYMKYSKESFKPITN